MSPPHESSKVIAIPMLTHRSRACLIFVSPPSLLIFRFTTSIARSALARSRMPRSSMFSSSTNGCGIWRRTARHSSEVSLERGVHLAIELHELARIFAEQVRPQLAQTGAHALRIRRQIERPERTNLAVALQSSVRLHA